jgi:hypothetical protein
MTTLRDRTLAPRARRMGVALAAALLTTGCYTYQMPLGGPPAVGSDVRARLSSEAVLRMQETFGQPRMTLEGELLEHSDSRILLLARAQSGSPVGFHPGQGPGDALRQRIALSPSEVLLLEEKRFSQSRTLGLSAFGSVVAGYLLYRALTWEPAGDSFGQPPGGPEMIRIRLP